MTYPLLPKNRKKNHPCIDCDTPLNRSNQIRCRKCRRKLENDGLRKLSTTKRTNKQANEVKKILENNPFIESIKDIYEVLTKKSKLNEETKRIKKLMISF